MKILTFISYNLREWSGGSCLLPTKPNDPKEMRRHWKTRRYNCYEETETLAVFYGAHRPSENEKRHGHKQYQSQWKCKTGYWPIFEYHEPEHFFPLQIWSLHIYNLTSSPFKLTRTWNSSKLGSFEMNIEIILLFQTLHIREDMVNG